MTRGFVTAIERYVKREEIDLIRFQRGERKDHRAQDYLRRWSGTEGVLFVGKAGEGARAAYQRRHNPNSDSTYPWLESSTATVNYYYFYAVDEDFGPFFIKFCSLCRRRTHAAAGGEPHRGAPAGTGEGARRCRVCAAADTGATAT